MPRRIVYLNGTSSAGKTSIAIALQDLLEEDYLRLGIDTFLGMLPGRLFGVPPDFEFERLPDGGARPRAGFAGGLGPLVFRCLAALAESHNVIFDDVICDPEWLATAVATLAPFDVLFVGVHCPIEVLERRERLRGDRVQGLARGMLPAAHAHELYDIVVDTSELSASECAETIRVRLRDGPAAAAFPTLEHGLTS